MGTVTVLTAKVAATNRLYLNLMKEAEEASGDASSAVRRGWWALLQIKAKRLWQAGGFKDETDWVASFTTESWAPSRATFYGVMQAVDNWRALGAGDTEVRELLGKRKVAIESDLKDWFQPGKTKTLRPEVAMMLAAKHETPLEALERIADLSPAQARVATGEVVDRQYFYVAKDSMRWMNATTLRMLVRHEHSRIGLLAEHECKVTINQLEGKPQDAAEVAQWVLSRFGQ